LLAITSFIATYPASRIGSKPTFWAEIIWGLPVIRPEPVPTTPRIPEVLLQSNGRPCCPGFLDRTIRLEKERFAAFDSNRDPLHRGFNNFPSRIPDRFPDFFLTIVPEETFGGFDTYLFSKHFTRARVKRGYLDATAKLSKMNIPRMANPKWLSRIETLS
jgi:hypothetical protein